MNKSKKMKLRLINGAMAVCVLAAAGSGGTLIMRSQAKEQNDSLLESLAAVAGGDSEYRMDMLSGNAWLPEDAGQPGSGSGPGMNAGSGSETGPGGGSDIGTGQADGSGAGGGSGTGSGQNAGPGQAAAPPPLTPEIISACVSDRANRFAGYQTLKAENQDMAGWVTVPGTRIDYPVMQTVESPNYYLKHDFEQKKSSYGVPYAAEHCDLEAGCSNVVIYGHHMKNGSMFAGLMKYTEKEFWRQHPYVWFDTLTEPGLYEIIGTVKASASAGDEDIFRLAYADTEEEYKKFIEELKRRSLYDTGLTAEYGEPLVTLITCEYTRDEGRLLVTARKMGN